MMTSAKPVPRLLARLRHRPLTSDEEHLWSLVSRTVRPLRPGKKPAIDSRHKAGVRRGIRPAADAAEPQVAVSPKHSSGAAALSPISRKERQKLARRDAAIDARIDLHGMTQAEAYGALARLLHRSQANGAKFVLVITGKGAPNASRIERGVLRRQVPMWLALPEFRRYVLGFDVADTGHGGEGALYVRLRKAKV